MISEEDEHRTPSDSDQNVSDDENKTENALISPVAPLDNKLEMAKAMANAMANAEHTGSESHVDIVAKIGFKKVMGIYSKQVFFLMIIGTIIGGMIGHLDMALDCYASKDAVLLEKYLSSENRNLRLELDNLKAQAKWCGAEGMDDVIVVDDASVVDDAVVVDDTVVVGEEKKMNEKNADKHERAKLYYRDGRVFKESDNELKPKNEPKRNWQDEEQYSPSKKQYEKFNQEKDKENDSNERIDKNRHDWKEKRKSYNNGHKEHKKEWQWNDSGEKDFHKKKDFHKNKYYKKGAGSHEEQDSDENSKEYHRHMDRNKYLF